MYVNRHNQEIITASFEKPFVTGLLGPRRVGKSMLVAHYAEIHPERSWVKFNMDERHKRLRVEEGQLREMIQEGARRKIGEGDKLWVCIDEAQKCPVIFEQIKILYDEFKDKEAIKFILTGSAFLELHQLSAESLAGRIELLHLREFNLQETAALNEDLILPEVSLLDALDHFDIAGIEKCVDAFSPLKPILENYINAQMIWGGLPEVYRFEKEDDRRAYLNNYLQTYLEKDIRAVSSITDINLYHKMMNVVAEQTGSLRQDKNIVEALECSRETLKKYRGLLSSTLVYKEVYPFIGSAVKRLVKSPKGYLLNNGLISNLTGVDDLEFLKKGGLIGHRFENWLLKELQVWLDRNVKRSEIYYWRTSSGVEVDFIVEKKPEIYPFEVTCAARPRDKKLKNLIHFLRENPEIKMGFYVYLGPFKYDAKHRICYIPAWAIS